MPNSNQHIEEFLNYYLNVEQSPDYAVLITGCWGSGKTYFIRQFLEKNGAAGKNVVKIFDWLTGFEKYTVVYVSLFGVKTREDINKKIERILQPKVNSKKLDYLPDAVSLVSNLAGIAVGTAIAATATVATEGLTAPYAFPAAAATGKTFGSFFKILLNKIFNRRKDEDYFASDFLDEIKKKRLVVIFDDVERADMPLPELLGYLNEYVEHLHVPCILLADKDKWEEAQKCQEDKSTLHHLSSTKEKVIGKEFQIQTSVEDVVNAWLNPENGYLEIDAEIKNLWWNNRECVYELFSSFNSAKQKYLEEKEEFLPKESEQKKYDREQMKNYVQRMPDRNYRALKQTIKDFNHLCIYFCFHLGNLIFSEKSKKSGFDKYFIRYFLAMRYGCLLGLFDPSQIDITRHFWIGDKIGERQYPAQKNSLTTWDCFSNVCYKMDTIENFPMQKWLVDSCFDREKTIAEIESSAWFAGRDDYLIRKIYHWWDLNDEEAKEAFIAVNNALRNGTLKSSAALMILFVVLYSISDDGGTNNKQFVIQQMNEYLNDFSNSIEFDEIVSIKDIEQNYNPSNDCIEKVIAFRERLLQIYNERKDPYQKEIEQFYKNLTSSNPYEFNSACDVIQNISHKITKFQWYMVDVEKFVDGYMKIERYKKGEIRQIMRYRYANVPTGYSLEKEKVFLCDLKKECLNRINQKHEVPLPSTFSLKQLIERIEYLENVLENKEGEK